MKVLVATEHTADDRKSLAAVRALARSGCTVLVGSDTWCSAPAWSRYCSARVRYPDPVADNRSFIRWLRTHVAEMAYDVILPLTDYTTKAVVENKAYLLKFTHLAVPELNQLELVNDKLALLRFAREAGIEIPVTHAPGDRQELLQLSRKISYPCVFKLRRGAGAVGLGFPRNERELADCFDNADIPSDKVFEGSRPLVQEYIPGYVHDACLLFNRGEPRAGITQRRLMMYPPAGGVGIYNETTDEPELLQQAIVLLEKLKWHGPAMVEFKLDARDNIYKLMEINSRYWGTLDAAIQAGINFPRMACEMATTGDTESCFAYTVGDRYRWPVPEGIKYAWKCKSDFRAMSQFFRTGGRIHSDFWLNDPLPAIMRLF